MTGIEKLKKANAVTVLKKENHKPDSLTSLLRRQVEQADNLL